MYGIEGGEHISNKYKHWLQTSVTRPISGNEQQENPAGMRGGIKFPFFLKSSVHPFFTRLELLAEVDVDRLDVRVVVERVFSQLATDFRKTEVVVNTIRRGGNETVTHFRFV